MGGGQIVDAKIVQAHRQRMRFVEKPTVKCRDIAAEWQRRRRKLAQEDRDAGWTVEFSKAKVNPKQPNAKRPNAKQIDIAIPAFGSKDHIEMVPDFRTVC